MQVCDFITDTVPLDKLMATQEARRTRAGDLQVALAGLLPLLAPTRDVALRWDALRILVYAKVCTCCFLCWATFDTTALQLHTNEQNLGHTKLCTHACASAR
jgi:hypothetical protein